MVLTALAAGAGAGVKETASAAVKDAYGALREALAERFRGKASAEVALVEHASSPQTWQAPLAQYVEEIGVDERLLQLAQGLLQALQVGQAGQGQGGAGHACRTEVMLDTVGRRNPVAPWQPGNLRRLTKREPRRPHASPGRC